MNGNKVPTSDPVLGAGFSWVGVFSSSNDRSRACAGPGARKGKAPAVHRRNSRRLPMIPSMVFLKTVAGGRAYLAGHWYDGLPWLRKIDSKAKMPKVGVTRSAGTGF